MATAKATVFIGGTQLLPYHVHIEQRSDWHHQFEITVSTEKAGVTGGAKNVAESVIIDNAIALAGETVEITIERPSGSLKFKGYITDVQIDQSYAGDAFIIFMGYSPTYLLEGQRSVASFEEMTLSDIFNEVTTDFPENIKKEVNPKFTDPIPYVTRYKETQFQFLSRLAAIHGEWFYYDGQKIVFGELPSKNPKVSLKFGSDSMLSFNYGINLRPSSFKQQFYKYQDNGTLENSVKGFSPGWLDAHSKTSLKASKDLFQEEGLQPIGHDVKDAQYIKYLAETKKSALTGSVMIFTGQSADPAIAVGAEVEVNTQKGFMGKYRVLSVTHNFNSNRDYNNSFRAIPVSTLVPPMRRNVMMPMAEPQAAVVVDNVDPDKLGRVRVQFKWQEGMTPWVRVLTNHAGEDRGTYFIPEIDDEVFVEFEQGNPDRPYVVGSNYHGGIPSPFADPDNNLKAIKTRSGHILQFDDKDGEESILITDKKGNFLKIETQGDNIFMKAGTSIFIEAGDSVFVEASNSVSIRAGNSISLGAMDINLVAGRSVNISSGGSYNLTATNKMEVIQKSSVLQTKNLTNLIKEDYQSNAKNIYQSATQSINTKAKDKIIVSAKNKLEQRGGEMDFLTQKGKIKMKAKSNVEIKGSQVKTN